MIVALWLLISLAGCCRAFAVEPVQADPADDTMLMFIGEAQQVVTVASRFPESPTTAPAIVISIERDEIENRGYRTLGELLADQPGFFIATGGRGSVPYLRGLRDSVLFLYDGVPMTTDVTKSFAPLDYELSLSSVDRVEIIRGPGSVLWGPDAFAGVVNIVPLSGRQQPVAKAEITAGNDDLKRAGFSWGQTWQNGEAFLALNAGRNRYYDDDFMDRLEDGQFETKEVDRSEYAEIVGTLSFRDWLHISGRWSDFSRRYTMRDATEELQWTGEKEAPVNQIKISINKSKGSSHYNLTGYLQETNYQLNDADIIREQRNNVSYLEFLWDRRIFERGMLTVGLSQRRNSVEGALVRDGFLPEFLASDHPIFVPKIEQADFANSLKSAFGQFRYQWGDTALWFGTRLDDHSQYESTLSYSLGFHRPLGEALHLKATYGTAFRSPYSSQLYDNLGFEPESIRTASTQLTWRPQAESYLELTLFHSQVEDLRVEDPYGGLSLPAAKEFYGLELAGKVQLSPSVSVDGSFTALGDSGKDDSFRVIDFCIIRPDGNTVCTYDEWQQPSDSGPNWIAQLGLNWQIGAAHSLSVRARTAASYDYSFRKGEVAGSYSQPLLLDLSYRRPGFFSGRDSIAIKATNLFDRDYQQPDVLGPVNGPPLQINLSWSWIF